MMARIDQFPNGVRCIVIACGQVAGSTRVRQRCGYSTLWGRFWNVKSDASVMHLVREGGACWEIIPNTVLFQRIPTPFKDRDAAIAYAILTGGKI